MLRPAFRGPRGANRPLKRHLPLLCPVRLADDDRHLLLLRPAHLNALPPLDEWSAPFGDGVRNLRAALDVLCWHLAHLDGGTSANEKAIAFPVVSDAGKWPEARKRLASVPEELLERIEGAQPFAHPSRDPTEGLHMLEALTELSPCAATGPDRCRRGSG